MIYFYKFTKNKIFKRKRFTVNSYSFDENTMFNKNNDSNVFYEENAFNNTL